MTFAPKQHYKGPTQVHDFEFVCRFRGRDTETNFRAALPRQAQRVVASTDMAWPTLSRCRSRELVVRSNRCYQPSDDEQHDSYDSYGDCEWSGVLVFGAINITTALGLVGVHSAYATSAGSRELPEQVFSKV